MTTEMHFEDTKVDLSRQKGKEGVGAVIKWVGCLPYTWSIGFDWGGIMEGGVGRKGGEEREKMEEGRGGKGRGSLWEVPIMGSLENRYGMLKENWRETIRVGKACFGLDISTTKLEIHTSCYMWQ